MTQLSDRDFRPILDQATDGVLIEARENIVYANESYATSLGYRSPREILGSTIGGIVSEEDSDRLLWFSRRREQGQPAPRRYSFRGRHRNGTAIIFDASVSTAVIGSQLLITTIVREMSPAENRVSLNAIPGLQQLSPREYDVLKQIVSGKRAKEIALLMDISEKTVATYRSRVYQKLALRSEIELFRFAVQHGLLDRLL